MNKETYKQHSFSYMIVYQKLHVSLKKKYFCWMLKCHTGYTHCFLCGLQKLLLRHLCKFLHFILWEGILKRKGKIVKSTTKWGLLILSCVSCISVPVEETDKGCQLAHLTFWSALEPKDRQNKKLHYLSRIISWSFAWNRCFTGKKRKKKKEVPKHTYLYITTAYFLVSLIQWKPFDRPFSSDLIFLKRKYMQLHKAGSSLYRVNDYFQV